MNTNLTAAKQKIQALRLDFIRQLPEMLEALETALAGTLEGRFDSTMLAQAERQAHTLAGTAATFELAEIHRSARELEALLNSSLSVGRIPDQDTLRLQFAVLNVVVQQAQGQDNASAAPHPENAGQERPRADARGRKRILIAEDSRHQREVLQALLGELGYEVEAAGDGTDAWTRMQKEDSPALLLLDSVMPGMSGPEICSRARLEYPNRPRHIILLTVKATTEDIRKGLDSGADDYIVKPYQVDELLARLHAGSRAIALQMELAKRVRELEVALDRVEKLEGILPICSYCKNIRDDRSDWKPVEEYVSRRSEVRFSHGICPRCYTRHVEPMLEGLQGS